WLARAELVRQQLGQTSVPTFGHPADLGGGICLARVVVNVEMLGGEDFEVELVVLDFVLSEVLRAGWEDRTCQNKGNGHNPRARTDPPIIRSHEHAPAGTRDLWLQLCNGSAIQATRNPALPETSASRIEEPARRSRGHSRWGWGPVLTYIGQ